MWRFWHLKSSGAECMMSQHNIMLGNGMSDVTILDNSVSTMSVICYCACKSFTAVVEIFLNEFEIKGGVMSNVLIILMSHVNCRPRFLNKTECNIIHWPNYGIWLYTNIYDTRDDFSFPIVPFLNGDVPLAPWIRDTDHYWPPTDHREIVNAASISIP